MDLPTWPGLIGALGAVTTASLMGGGFSTFSNGSGLRIVDTGTKTVVLMKYPLSVAAAVPRVPMAGM
jgi:flagellar motor component MotA